MQQPLPAECRPGRGHVCEHDQTVGAGDVRPCRAVVSPRATRPPILDRTGLTGDFNLEVQREQPITDVNASSGGPSLFTALQEQTGLTLETVREMMDVLVTDATTMPEPD